MKKLIPALFSVFSFVSYAGDMGPQTPLGDIYTVIGGGYYASNYFSNYTGTASGLANRKQTFNNTNNNGYLQVGIGQEVQIGSLPFAHQLDLQKLFGKVEFKSPGQVNVNHTSTWNYYQNLDFGYDFMPKISLPKGFIGYGILGVHYARFTYQKKVESTTSTKFNDYADQIGFNLGAALYYPIYKNLIAGVKYQHLQYSKAQISGINQTVTQTNLQNFSPAFNLVGGEMRYVFS